MGGVPACNTIVTHGPEISGITPLKYDVTLLNMDGQQVQVQFTTLQSSATYPGFGTPVGSLVDFSGGSFMQGSNSGPLDIGYGRRAVYLQNFRGRSEEHTSELQSLMRISYAVFCLKKKKQTNKN